MRRFCRWLVTEGELEVAPTDGIEIPAPPEKPVPILTDEEITALLMTCAVPPRPARCLRPHRLEALRPTVPATTRTALEVEPTWRQLLPTVQLLGDDDFAAVVIQYDACSASSGRMGWSIALPRRPPDSFTRSGEGLQTA
jgi:hypothetical protein